MENQSENKFVGIYHHAVKSGLFNSDFINKNSNILSDNMVPIARVNNFFFGTNSFANKFNYLNLAKEEIIYCLYGIYYLQINKLENYLDHVISIINIESSFNYFPYNYYKFMEGLGKQVEIPLQYQLIIKTFDNFLQYLDSVDTTQTRTIRYILTPTCKPGQFNKLECEIADVLSISHNQFDNEFIIKLNKKGAPLFLRLSCKTSDSDILFLQLNPNNKNFQTVCDYISNKLLMDSPEDFLINNIERVCGSSIFAEIMVKSYLNKKDFIFSIESISSIILWKNISIQLKYINYFHQKYSNCIKELDNNMMVNFEGINKFLLNISEDDVENFEVKEQINEMYYNSMYELIHSFEQLYKNKNY